MHVSNPEEAMLYVGLKNWSRVWAVYYIGSYEAAPYITPTEMHLGFKG